MSMIQSDLLLGQEGGAGYAVERSLRFNSSDSAYLSRTPASAGNRKTWTWAGWVKLDPSSEGYAPLFSAGGTGTNSDYAYIRWNRAEASPRFEVFLGVLGGVGNGQAQTNAVARDYSSWYHLVCAIDTSLSTATDRIKVYINGVRQTFSLYTAPSQNLQSVINNNRRHGVGAFVKDSGQESYFSGYLADVHFIDGQALDPSSFVETSATTGQLIPKQYTGSFGTNGFWLKFSDNSAATATTLGKDYSGNSNNWTPNNLSVTAGAGNDSLVDTPTSFGSDTGAGGEVRGNYPVMNPLAKGTNTVLSNGNLDVTGAAVDDFDSAFATIQIPATGKWYFEFTVSAHTAGYTAPVMGVATSLTSLTQNYFVGGNSNEFGWDATGSSWLNGTQTNRSLASVAGDVMQLAVDTTNGKIWAGRNNTWAASGDPGAGTNPLVSSSTFATALFFAISSYNTQGAGSINFGQRSWAYQAPTGFKALVDTNLPSPSVAKSSDYFQTVLYTGNGSTQTISGLGFSPDLVWGKGRSYAGSNALYDSVRGATKYLTSNGTGAEGTVQGVTAFNSDGFTLGNDSETNFNAGSLVAWCWDAGSSTVTNTQGSITSQVRANASAGFSIVTLTTPAAATSFTVGHGLGVAPEMIIVKQRNSTSGWAVYHKHVGASPEGRYLLMNTTDAVVSSSLLWNNTAPTSTIFSSYTNGVWGQNATLVAYCFAPVAGYSSFGSYTGNGSTDGPFVFCGFRPRWILIKQTTAVGGNSDWAIFDTARSGYNANNNSLYPSSSQPEDWYVLPSEMDILSNGFKPRASRYVINSSGGTYVWAAFAESPFQYARAR